MPIRKGIRRGRAEAIVERRARAFDLRKAGMTYDQIGKALGVSVCSAHKDVHRVLDELAEKTRETAIEVRDLELHRLDTMLASVWSSVCRGDTQSVTTALRISERRARLLGLDAATKAEVTGPDGGPLAIGQSIDVTKISDDDLAKLAEILDRADSAGR